VAHCLNILCKRGGVSNGVIAMSAMLMSRSCLPALSSTGICRIFKYSDIHYTSLTLDKILNSLVYRMLFYVNIYESYNLLKNSPVFWPTL